MQIIKGAYNNRLKINNKYIFYDNNHFILQGLG